MFTNKKKTTYTKNIYYNNISNNNIYPNSDYFFNNENNYYYQKRTTQIKTYSLRNQDKDEDQNENNFINNNFNENSCHPKSSEKKIYEKEEQKYIKYKKKNKITEKINFPKSPDSSKKKLILGNYVNNTHIYKNNTHNSKLLSNNLDLIKKKKELEEQRERERKIMEWFYINNISISKRDMYDALTTLIQSVFRGWQFRNEIANIFHHNNMSASDRDINDIKNGFLKLNKILINKLGEYLLIILSKIKNKKNNEDKNEKEKMYKEIRELIKQNNDLQKKLGNILNENKNLKNETEKYKEYKNKYKEIFDQVEKVYTVNNSIIEENQILKNKLNKITNDKGENKNFKYFIIEKLKSINYKNKNNEKNKKLREKETQYELDNLIKIQKLKNINILCSNKKINLNKYELQKLNQINIYSDNFKNNPHKDKNNFEITKENNINIYSNTFNNNLYKDKNNFQIVKENNLNLITLNTNNKDEILEKENNLNLYKNMLRHIILKKFISKKINANKEKLGLYYFKLKNRINELKISEKDEKIKEFQNEVELLRNNLNESNNNKILQKNLLKSNKLKSLFNYKSLINKCSVHKYFLLFYFKSLSLKDKQNENNISSQILSTAVNTQSTPTLVNDIINPNSNVSPIINEISQNDNKEIVNNNPVNSIDIEKINKEKEEKEEMEKKSRILKARNLRKLLIKKAHEKKDIKRLYFYKYEHIIMMMKIRNKLIEMKKRQMEKDLKEEKKENEKYRLIQSQRNKQERIFAIFNKLDKRISQIKRTVLEAWNVKAKVMSIKTILQPIKNKPKKKKKKSKKEENKDKEGQNEIINKERN